MYTESQLGVYDVRIGSSVPEEASWVVAFERDYGKPMLLENPGFESGLQGWGLYTPPDKTPLLLDTLPGYVGNSAVMVSDELGYKAGIRQSFSNVPPNTTFHFKAMIKTVDAEALEARVLHYSIYVGGVWREEGTWGYLQGSQDWALYEVSFTTPNDISVVNFFPALVYNRGEVWIDEASLDPQPSPARAILNWHAIHSAWDPFNPFETEAELEYVEAGLKTVPTENFWGIIFIAEEHYRDHVGFNDDVSTTWFGEVLLGYPLYLAESPGATVDQWKDEMFLRMIRGFYNYFHPLTKVGMVFPGAATRDIPRFFGTPALNFIKENYHFLVLYDYSDGLDDYLTNTKPFFDFIDAEFQKQQVLWILTRIFGTNETWELEAMALEMKNCFDRNIAVTSYYWTIPPLEEVWPLMLKARELYDAKAPYYEIPVYGKNLLTGYVGDTYGWVEVSG